VSKVG